MRAAHGGADARGDLVADDHGAQEVRTLETERVRRGDGRRAGVVDAVAIDVVHLDRMRSGAVDERHGARVVSGERLLEQRRRRYHSAGVKRGVPIDDRASRVVRDFRRDRPRAPVRGPRGIALDDVH